ncbi:MAG: hypothetical protein M3Y72_26535, partial [Acidobacteriota bacterium]|nr:hypothetical protein [Acidobacteriota bacterium]
LLTYKRELANLSTQETRLRRHREKDLAALEELQDARQKQTRKRLETAARRYIQAVNENTNDNFDLGQFGFEFSLVQIEMCAMDLRPNLFEHYEAELANKRSRSEAA